VLGLSYVGENFTQKSFVKEGQLEVMTEVLACGFKNQKFHLTPWKVLETSNCNSTNSNQLQPHSFALALSLPQGNSVLGYENTISPLMGCPLFVSMLAFIILKGQMQSGHGLRTPG
jgi:hypothetical protein